MEEKVCCFIGHRKIEKNLSLENKILNIIEDFIVNKNVKYFLLGSKSEFNYFCYTLLRSLKQKYPYITIVAYDLENEYSLLECEREKYEKILHSQNIIFVDKIYKCQIHKFYGRTAYIERNKIMINKSDYCIFYYNKNYIPPIKKRRKIIFYQPNSGTYIAYKYAAQKNKKIFNVFE